jgi:exopolyphosphatase/guanosine-5'-triphosphate,3'-diphosphate pyrophosphatase
LKLAAIDIGANAVRLQISQVIDTELRPQFKTLEYIRFPLALGKEVFAHQHISAQGEQDLKKLLQAFKILIELHQVDKYKICATSSWREAKNKVLVKTRLEEDLGIDIHVIDGEKEADLINQAIQAYVQLDQYVHIDVGGGSTEVSFYRQQKKLATNSFQLGSLKDNSTVAAQAIWSAMKTWIIQYKEAYNDRLLGIATGGNIRKLIELAKPNQKLVSLKRLMATQQYLASYDLTERMQRFRLNPDRAALILPASEIYLTALNWAGVKHTLVPHLGLRDGIIQSLYEKHRTQLNLRNSI